jgi:hypothetical protein
MNDHVSGVLSKPAGWAPPLAQRHVGIAGSAGWTAVVLAGSRGFGAIGSSEQAAADVQAVTARSR